MVPQIWCREHKEVAKARKTYDLAEVDQRTGLTSLQMFVRNYKDLHLPSIASGAAGAGVSGGDSSSYALLRRAKRYDSLLTSGGVLGNTGTPAPSAPLQGRGRAGAGNKSLTHPSQTSAEGGNRKEKKCSSCSTRFSPYWWPLPTSLVKSEQDFSSLPARGEVCCNYCKETRYKDAFSVDA